MLNRTCGNCAHSERSYTLCKKEGCFNGGGPKWVHTFDLHSARNRMEMHIRKKQERKLSECDFCVHKNVSFSEVPCCVCRGIFPNRFKEKEKQMETYPLNLTPPTDEEFKNAPVWHDYSFSKEIVAALKDHKPVWYKCNCGQPECNCWVEIKYDEKIVLSDLYDCSWSLEKPKVKVKKTKIVYTGEAGMHNIKNAQFFYWLNKRNIPEDIEITMSWEEEE